LPIAWPGWTRSRTIAVLAAYTYLGARMIVIEDFQEPDLKLDCFGCSSGTYAVRDNFDHAHAGHDNINRVLARAGWTAVRLWANRGARWM
jgi:hypothetical protein